MIAEFGHFSLILAAVLAVVQALVPLIGAQIRRPGWMALGDQAAVVQGLLAILSFLALCYSFAVSDFSLALVYANSHSSKPMLYKIAGVWGNHEGSMLLWIVILAVFGAAVAVFGRALPSGLRARVLGVQGLIGVAFYGFVLFTSNPFLRLAEPPLDGAGLNPLLQDPGLAFHPPFLYLGYVGLSVAFSFAIAALLEGRVDAAWGRWVRPWSLAAWVFLTIGIALGSWWAYYELGWGGFWFWDPVENASFMPWLFAAALLHSAIVVEKRESLKSWSILLAILGFGFSLLGTFIVRSGVLTSVHAFANDPARGTVILAILALFVGGALILFTWRATALESRGVFALVSRESALVLNNVLLSVSSLVVFVGTMWPLVAELIWDRSLSVGAPFFNAAFAPFMVALALVLPIGAILAWKRGNLARAVRLLWPAMLLAVALGGLAFALQTGRSALAPIGIALGAWVALGACVDIWQRAGGKAARLWRLPGGEWGKALGHVGFGITIIGICAMMGWAREDIRAIKPGEGFTLAGWSITLAQVSRDDGPNYQSYRGDVVMQRGNARHVLHPEKRFYPVEGMPTTEAGIRSGFARDLYVALGDPQPDGGWALRSYIKPLANWIWGGALIMALGGVVSLFDRRLRVAVGRRRA